MIKAWFIARWTQIAFYGSLAAGAILWFFRWKAGIEDKAVDEAVEEIKELDREHARKIRDRVDAVDRARGVPRPDDSRGYRD